MVAFTLAGQGVAGAVLRVPRYGIATAERVQLQASPSPALVVGQRATLQLGDLAHVGTLLPGGDWAGAAAFGWIAGAGRWDTTVERRAYRDDAGVLLSQVLADLAADAGELGAVLDGTPERVLGKAWVRPKGVASDLLRALVGDAWWIGQDGVTHVGPRPSSAVAPADLTVDPYDPALRMATVALASDEVAQLLPGAVLTAQGLPEPLAIGQLEVRAEAQRVEAVLWGERPPSELLAAVIEAIAERARYAAPLPYQVTGTSGPRSTVEPADARAVAFPGVPFLDHVYGLPGASAQLAPGAAVLVGFPAGDPGGPVVMHYLPGVLPLTVALNAQTTITLGGAGATAPSKASLVDANLAAINLALQDLGHAGLSLVPTGASRVRVE